MAIIKWKKKTEIEQEKLEKEQKKAKKEKLKDKSKLSRKELDDLIIIMAEEMGLI